MARDTGTLDTGNWAPVREERDDYALPVKGELPRELSGTLFRNGPNPQFDTPDAHWFVGDGMLHAFTLENGKASYRNRWVRTPKFLAEHDAGRAIWSGKGFGGQKLPDAPPTERHGRRRRQHQCHLARRQAAGARGGAPADRDRSQDARHARLRGLCARHRRAGHRPPQDRSRHRRADLLRLQRDGPVLRPA